jgi:hypothetical protein
VRVDDTKAPGAENCDQFKERNDMREYVEGSAKPHGVHDKSRDGELIVVFPSCARDVDFEPGALKPLKPGPEKQPSHDVDRYDYENISRCQ